MQDSSQVQTASDLRAYVRACILQPHVQAFRGSLEDYLRSLWALIEQHRESPVSYGLLARLLADAFTQPPAPLDPRWLAYQKPPADLRGDLSHIEDDYAFVREMILYQIVDLFMLAEEDTLYLTPHERYLGARTPHGDSWFNLDPVSYLESASFALPDDSTRAACDWRDLALFLWLGQSYE